MRSKSPKPHRLYVYQLRSGMGDDPTEILTRLTHHVWQKLEQKTGSMDPHLWPEIFKILRESFKHRLSFNPQCGHFDACLEVPCVLCGQRPHTHDVVKKVFLLETRRPLMRFLRAVSTALERRLRLKGVSARGERRNLHADLQAAMEEALKEHLFVSEPCSDCPARESLSDRRIWARDLLETPWGAWQNVLPQETLRVEEVEEA